MQPTYLPWAGYFNLISRVDTFVFLDDVQFEHQSWQTRNRILLQGQEHQLVVPVQRAPLATPIQAVRLLENDRWRAKHWRTLTSAYGRAAHGQTVLDLLAKFYSGGAPSRLAELNEGIVATIASALGLEAKFRRASDLGCGGTRSMHLVEICRAVGCDEYLSPAGSRAYLAEDGFEHISDIGLEFQEFVPEPYPQSGAKAFIPRLSVIDAIANLGIEGCKDYVRDRTE